MHAPLSNAQNFAYYSFKNFSYTLPIILIHMMHYILAVMSCSHACIYLYVRPVIEEIISSKHAVTVYTVLYIT